MLNFKNYGLNADAILHNVSNGILLSSGPTMGLLFKATSDFCCDHDYFGTNWIHRSSDCSNFRISSKQFVDCEDFDDNFPSLNVYGNHLNADWKSFQEVVS